MTIVITGCNGQLGNELCRILKNGKSEIGEIPKQYKNAKVIPVDVDTLDITDGAAVKEFLTDNSPDIVINCAAMTDVNGCEMKQNVAFKVNAKGVMNLAKECKKIKAKFVHISTDYVFAGDGTVPYCEWDTVNPQSIYFISQICFVVQCQIGKPVIGIPLLNFV